MVHPYVLWSVAGVCSLVTILILLTPTQESERQRLEQLLGHTVAVLEAAEVTYWVCDGTLIGAFRDARVVLGDFDADLNIPIESLDAIRRVDWQSAGLVCYEGYGGFRIKAWSLDTLRIDIFVRRDVGGMIVYGWPHLDSMYEKTVTPASFIFPLRRYKMSIFEVYGPAKPHVILSHQYGAYSLSPPKTWAEAMWVCFERQVWARVIPLASYFSPVMTY